MPIIEGKKWACESCIKGHRVSGCTHQDRPLKYIAPKGRPQKQCEHCRTARKSKAHHAKCDCGDKKDKMRSDTFEVFGHDAPDMPEHDCCCIHGEQCTCGTKKGSASSKLESGPSRPTQHAAKSRPKFTTAPSENGLVIFANSHHKPSHRLNNAAHVSGAPYKIPRSHTLHGPSTAMKSTYPVRSNINGFIDVPQRSVDDSVIDMNSGTVTYGMPDPPHRSASGLSSTFQSYRDARNAFGVSYSHSAPFAAPTATSVPVSATTLQSTGTSTTEPWANFSAIMPTSLYGSDDYSTSPVAEFSANTDYGWSVPSAGTGPSWSAGDLPLDPAKVYGSFVQQALSHSGDSTRHSAPELTASSSAAQSEAGDYYSFGDLDLSAQQPGSNKAVQPDLQPPSDQATHQLSSSSEFEALSRSTLSSSAPYDGRSFDTEVQMRTAQGMHDPTMPVETTDLSWQQGLDYRQTSAYQCQSSEQPRQPSFDYNNLLSANLLPELNFEAPGSLTYDVPDVLPRSMTMPADLSDFSGAEWASILTSAPNEFVPLQPLDIQAQWPVQGSWLNQ